MKAAKFGTDGIRGIYGRDLTEETAYALGRALGERGEVLIGEDNRPSSDSLARAVACGVDAVGGLFHSVGLTTTPALYYLLTQRKEGRAVMVTASHNPPAYNGLKVFTRSGKLDREEKERIEDAIRLSPSPSSFSSPYEEEPALLDSYEDFFRERIGSLEGMRVVLDFAGGAGYRFKGLLGTLGATVIPLNLREKGERINENAGALHPKRCAEETRRAGADLGIALDGDGDRIIAADGEGNILDGDLILHLLACRMQAKGMLRKSKVVMTVMTNGGVVKSLAERGIEVVTCAVGDAAVAATMREEDLSLGGEQSGHVILGDLLMTGDALLVGAALLKSIREEGPLSLTPPPRLYPQMQRNLPVKDKSVATDPALLDRIRDAEDALCGGRILLRPSGTEEVVRLLVEHPDAALAGRIVDRLSEEILRLSRP